MSKINWKYQLQQYGMAVVAVAIPGRTPGLYSYPSPCFIMKWGGWVKWYKVGGSSDLVHPEWPGAGLLVGWFMAFVVLIRLAELGGPRIGRAIWYASVVLLPVVYIVTFWWGRQFITQ